MNKFHKINKNRPKRLFSKRDPATRYSWHPPQKYMQQDDCVKFVTIYRKGFALPLNTNEDRRMASCGESTSSLRFLVTAGNTRELIDRVRDWGNIFTGNTGFRIAQALTKVGEVELLTSNLQHVTEAEPLGIRATPFRSHADLKTLLASKLGEQQYDGIFMTAAVADYAPKGVFAVTERRQGDRDGEEVWIVRNVNAPKVKSTHQEIAVLGSQTEKLVDLFRREWNHTGLLVKFKLEVGISKEQLIEIGQKSRKSSGADYLVANTLDMVEGTSAGAFLLGEGVEEWVSRDELATRLARLAGLREGEAPAEL